MQDWYATTWGIVRRHYVGPDGWIYQPFQAFFHYNTWKDISLGVHIGLGGPCLQIHVPSGFFFIGWYEPHPP